MDRKLSLKTPERRHKVVEGVATAALCLVALGLVAPFVSMENTVWIRVFKWIYTSGAALYLIARLCDVRDAADSLRLRRLRRLEAWAGIAFCIGAFFWFYNADRFGEIIWSLGLMRETVLFTLVGALIQIISSWMIVGEVKKMQKSNRRE